MVTVIIIMIILTELTIRAVLELFANHFSIVVVPAIVTDSPPLVVMTELHSTLGGG